MDELEKVLGSVCQAIRSKLSKANISKLALEINVEGRVDSSDELSIKYTLGESWTEYKVTGVNLTQVVAEHLRRHGWQEHNDYKALPAPKTMAELIDDEVTF